MSSANEIIVEFIKGQPDTIRDSVSAGFMMAQADGVGESNPSPNSSAELHQLAYDWIEQGSGISKTIWAAAAIGIIDQFFSEPPLTQDALQYQAERLDSDALREVARKSELRNRYFFRAAEDWKALRSTTLSFPILAVAPPTP